MTTVIEELEALKNPSLGNAMIQAFNDGIDSAIAIARKHEPEPVSLEECAIALWEPRNTHWTDAGKTAQTQYRRMAKACLNAAKVKWR